jgi:hypothetical protein
MKLSVTVSRAWRFAVLAGVVAGLTVTPAAASQGQAVLAGQINTETDSTVMSNTSTDPGDFECSITNGSGLTACGNVGLIGNGSVDGVAGTGVVYGVLGQTFTPDGTGVRGHSDANTGIGVQGDTNGVGSGVYGLANNTGVGVFGDTANGTGVLARSTNGTALDVRGKVTFSRSGVVTVMVGAASRKVTLAGVTGASMILATAQQDGAVYVRSAVPASGSFTIHLTGKAPAGGLKVAYFVLN